MKKSEYYKIVSKTPQGRMSMMSKCLPKFLRVTYKVHRWVSAPIGGLLVFDDYKEASEIFCNDGERDKALELWRVLVKEPVSLPPMRYSFGLFMYNPAFVENLWDRSVDAVFFWPPCTRAFKYVRLEERIK